MKLFSFAVVFLAFISFGTFQPPSGVTTFTPLHTYFISAGTCSDSNAGTSAGAPWCSLLTSNHSGAGVVTMQCGDVVIAATGAYTLLGDIDMQPANCPSTSGGIDGTGGIYAAVLLCAGNVGTCTSNSTYGDNGAISIQSNYWSVQGFLVNTGQGGGAFGHDCNAGGTNPRHHFSFINDIAVNNLVAFNIGQCGGTASADYYAVVGSIAQNSNTHGACVSAFNFVTPRQLDTTAGTHIFAYYNYGINNPGNSGCTSDGNGMIADTLDFNSYAQQVVFSNNIIFTSRQYGIHVFSQENNSVAPIVKVLNNTTYDNGNPTVTGSLLVTEITEYNLKYRQITQNNISLTSAATRNGADLYAFQYNNVNGSGTNTVAIVGGSGNENIFKASATSCDGGTCNSGPPYSVTAWYGGSFGTNTYTDPLFSNTTDLLTNQKGVPSCTSFENVTQCMGYNASTSSLTSLSVIGDLQASCAGCSGKGFQLPSTTCNTNADFPVWLKGIVYLHWTGSGVQQKQGLATTPCGL